MNKLFQQLLQQAGSRVLPQAQRAVQGFADDLVAPVLRGIATKANPGAAKAQLVRSVGAIEDALVRPVTRFGQEALANPLVGIPRTFVPGGAARDLVRQTVGGRAPFLMPPASPNNLRYTADPAQRFLQEFGRTLSSAAERTAASLRPGPSAAAFPFDDTLRLLQGRGQYLQRQAQGAFGALQNLGPTALNPLATQSPTTALGKVGKLFNPLNPVNARNYLTGSVISAFLPENDPNKGNLELFAFTPGGMIPKIAITTIFGATPAGPADESELMRQYSALAQMGKNYKVNGITYDYKTGKAINPPANVFIPARQGGGGSPPPPPAPTLPPPPGAGGSGAQAGQQTPIISDVPIGGSFEGGSPYRGPGVSNGAGVPALRQNVQNRALTQEVLNAAQQYSAPASVSLPSFYEGQQQLGRRMEQTGELQRQLKELGGATGMTPEALMKWAQANPGLAYRELQRLQGRSQ